VPTRHREQEVDAGAHEDGSEREAASQLLRFALQRFGALQVEDREVDSLVPDLLRRRRLSVPASLGV
jgi:hypothetical protein